MRGDCMGIGFKVVQPLADGVEPGGIQNGSAGHERIAEGITGGEYSLEGVGGFTSQTGRPRIDDRNARFGSRFFFGLWAPRLCGELLVTSKPRSTRQPGSGGEVTAEVDPLEAGRVAIEMPSGGSLPMMRICWLLSVQSKTLPAMVGFGDFSPASQRSEKVLILPVIEKDHFGIRFQSP